MNLVKIIKDRRRFAGLSQIELAVKSGVSLPTIQLLEAGKGNPTLAILKKLERVLGFSLEVKEEAPDWALLQRWILPITVVQKTKVSTQKPSPKKLLAELWKAISLGDQIEDERVREALISAIYAIRRFFPTLFSYFFDAKEAGRLFELYPTGRMIKLSRIACEKMAEVF